MSDWRGSVVQEVVIRINRDMLRQGIIPTTKVTPKGERTVNLGLYDASVLLNDLFAWEARNRSVTMMSRFETNGFIALGQNGGKWMAVKELEPSKYYLISATEKVYHCHLPRVIIQTSNYGYTYLFWTRDRKLKPTSRLYPLVLGNVSLDGQVCFGSTGLKCKSPEEVDAFARKIIEAPTSGHWWHVYRGRWFRKMREERGLLLEEVATAVKLTPETLAAHEADKKPMVNTVAYKLRDFFGLPGRDFSDLLYADLAENWDPTIGVGLAAGLELQRLIKQKVAA